jgi:hypothetical protein
MASALEENDSQPDANSAHRLNELFSKLGGVDKSDRPIDRLMLPRFEVDTNNVAGTTTLFAIRNVTNGVVEISISYFNPSGAILQATPPIALAAKETLTVNVRDIEGLLENEDEDGIAEGYATILALTGARSGKGLLPPPSRLIIGDYFRVTSDQDFASGDRLLNFGLDDPIYFDFCDRTESRFLNGGAFTGGTEFNLVSLSPNGIEEGDESTVLAQVYDEEGNAAEICQIFTDQVIVNFSAAALTAVPFGTVEFDFQEGLGQVLTNFDASNRFSVGMRAACPLPAILLP